MPEIKTSKIVRREYTHLGGLQRKILEFLVSQKRGFTISEIFEEVYGIPLTMGTMFTPYADIKISLDKEKGDLGVGDIRDTYLDLADRIEGHLIKEDKDLPEGKRDIKAVMNGIRRDVRNFNIYIKLINLDNLRAEFEARLESLKDDQDTLRVAGELREVVSKTINLADSVEGYRQEMRAAKAAGQGGGESAQERKALSNALRANLSNSLSTLKTRGLIAEAAPPAESHWRGLPSQIFITKKGFELLKGSTEE